MNQPEDSMGLENKEKAANPTKGHNKDETKITELCFCPSPDHKPAADEFNDMAASAFCSNTWISSSLPNRPVMNLEEEQ